MRSYIEDELPALLAAALPLDMARQGLSGHSMGGHGALTIGLRNPGRFRAVSAFAPIASPMDCPWGEKALSRYLGPDRAAWRPYDACALIADGARLPEILVDQGTADPFLAGQLKPELPGGGLPRRRHRPDPEQARRLRPFLLLHRELRRRPPAVACGSTGAMMRRRGFRRGTRIGEEPRRARAAG